MKYEKLTRKNYNIHIINTDRFKTVSVDIIFSNTYKKEDVAFLSLLIKMISSSSKKYNTSQLLAIEGENLYGAEITSYFNVRGNIENFGVSLEFLNPKYTDEKMAFESIEFLKECLFFPNIVSGGFEKKLFDINKNNLITNIKSNKDSAYSYALIKFKQEMYKDISMGYHLFNNIDKIEKITNVSLYNFYLKVLSNFKIDVFVTGNILNDAEYIDAIDRILNKTKNTNEGELNYEVEGQFSKNKKLIESANFSQSQLFVGYSFKDLTEYEKNYVLNFYNSILGGINNSILFSEVREKNSLCYSVNSVITKNPYTIRIETEIDKSNYERAIKLIDNSINFMNSKNKLKKLFEPAKENINTALNMFYDNKSAMMEYFYRKEFTQEDDIETKRKKYMNISIDDIVNLNKKIVKNMTYFLEGDKISNEEDNI